jgi:hypothetical protein
MVSDLQGIVDALAGRLGRPALVEDPGHRVVAYSEQTAPVDEIRLRSILLRRSPPEVVALVRRAGIPGARRPVRLPECRELRMLARLCVPLWHGDLLLGFVWFVDPDRSITDEDLDTVGSVTSDLSLALYWEIRTREVAARGQARAVRLLLADHPRSRTEALRDLLDDGVLAADGPVTALVAAGSRLDTTTRLALEQALLATRRRLGPDESAHLVRHDHGVLLVRAATRPGWPGIAEVAGQLARAVTAATADLAPALVIGVGQPQPEPGRAHTSYEQALLAARVAARLPELGTVAYWSELGVYQALARLSDEALLTTTVHPGLEPLLGQPASQPLLETLETYLDLAGNAQVAAERLNLHRTSLYYRLRRVEELTGSDLRSGSERLCLHLALKLARLAGRYQPGPAPARRHPPPGRHRRIPPTARGPRRPGRGGPRPGRPAR